MSGNPSSNRDAAMVGQLLDELARVSQMRESEDVGAFDRIMQALSGQELLMQELGVLLSVFADDTPHQDVMHGLLHLIEQSSNECVVAALIESANDMRRVAPEWLETFVCRLLNHDVARDALVAGLSGSTSAGGAVEIVSQIRSLLGDTSGSVRANALLAISALDQEPACRPGSAPAEAS